MLVRVIGGDGRRVVEESGVGMQVVGVARQMGYTPARRLVEAAADQRPATSDQGEDLEAVTGGRLRGRRNEC